MSTTPEISQDHSTAQVIHAKPVRHYGRWASAVVAAFIALCIIDTLITNPNYQWDVVAKVAFMPIIFQAIGWTLLLTIGAMTLGVIMAITMAVMRRSENPVLRGVSTVYICFFRGTPIYTQLIFWGLLSTLYPTMSLGVPFTEIDFFTLNPSELMPLQIMMFVCAVCGLGFNEGAYLSEIVRSGLNSVDAGQEEAAKALGMSSGKIFRRIVIPQAMRVIIPPTGNETISMLKTTSLVTAVPFTLELTSITNRMGMSSMRPVPYLIVAALWYLVVTSILMIGQHYLERYFGRGQQTSADTPSILAHHNERKRRLSRQAAINAAATTRDDPFVEYTP